MGMVCSWLFKMWKNLIFCTLFESIIIYFILFFFFHSPLHYAAAMTGPTDILELLVEFGADVDAINDDHCTPLFFATQANNYYAASALLNAGEYQHLISGISQ